MVSQDPLEEGDWTAYISHWEDGPGSILVRVDLIDKTPFEGFPYLFVTGLEYEKSPEDGLPKMEIYDELNNKCDKIIETVEKSTETIFIGTFTLDGKKKLYFYVKTKDGIEEKMLLSLR